MPTLRLLPLLSLLTACGELPVEEFMTLAAPEELAQIRNGSSDPVQRGVVGLTMISGGGAGGCTGTLIAENVVLTARHCVATLGNADEGVRCASTTAEQTHSARSVFVTVESSLRQRPSDYVAVEEIATPSDPLLCNTDIALLKLSRPIRHSDMPLIVPRIDSQVRDGEIYTIVGYGGTDDNGSGSGQRRIRDNRAVTCATGTCPFWAARDREWGGNGGVCRGDSGGPAIDSAGRVVGVASRGGQLCSSAIYSSVASWNDWIIDHVIEWTREEDLEIPLWADGWPTDPAYNARVNDRCDQDSECGYGRCMDGYCTRKCDSTQHCPERFECHNNWCLKVPQPIGATCGDDLECESEACADGVCTEWCETHSECPEGYGCDDSGRCAEGISRDSGTDEPPSGPPSAFGCSTSGLGLWLLPILLGLRRRY